jgi:hypothetical protein
MYWYVEINDLWYLCEVYLVGPSVLIGVFSNNALQSSLTWFKNAVSFNEMRELLHRVKCRRTGEEVIAANSNVITKRRSCAVIQGKKIVGMSHIQDSNRVSPSSM